jgi:RNA polymerase-associated protein
LLAAAVEQTKQIQAWLEQRLGSTPYFSGDRIGYADFAVAPIVNRSVTYGSAYGPAEGSALQKWHARISENPAVKETFAEMAEGLKGMSAMGPSAWKPHGGRRREYRDHRLEFLIKNGGINIVQKGIEDDNIRFSWPHPI